MFFFRSWILILFHVYLSAKYCYKIQRQLSLIHWRSRSLRSWGPCHKPEVPRHVLTKTSQVLGSSKGSCFLSPKSQPCRRSLCPHLAPSPWAWSPFCHSRWFLPNSESIGHSPTLPSTFLEHRKPTSHALQDCSRIWLRPFRTLEKCSQRWMPLWSSWPSWRATLLRQMLPVLRLQLQHQRSWPWFRWPSERYTEKTLDSGHSALNQVQCSGTFQRRSRNCRFWYKRSWQLPALSRHSKTSKLPINVTVRCIMNVNLFHVYFMSSMTNCFTTLLWPSPIWARCLRHILAPRHGGAICPYLKGEMSQVI